MAITIGDALFWLRADDSKLKGDLAAGASRVKEWVAGVGQTALLGIGGALAGASAGALAFAKSTIEGNAQFETYLTQFGVLLRDSELAKKRLEELAKFGAETPFELPEVVEADKILQGFGLHSEEAAKKFGFSGEQIRTIAGDVAAGAGVSFQDMATYIGKFASGATGEVISRFQELGIMTRDQMASWGLEFSKSGELLTPVDEAMDVVLAKMEEKYGGMMDAQSATLEGMKSNLSDWFDGMIREAGRPIFDKFKEALSKVLEILNSPAMSEGIKSFTEGLTALMSGDFNGFIDGMADAVLQVAQAFGLWGGESGNADEVVEGLRSFFQTVVPQIQAFATQAKDFITTVIVPFIKEHSVEILGALKAIGIALGAFMVISTIISLIGMIANPVTLIIGLIALLGAAWAGNWGGIQEKTQAVIGFLKNNLIGPFLTWLKTFWAENGEAIMAKASAIWEFIKQGFNRWVKGMEDIFALFSLAFQGKWREFGEKLREIFDKKLEETKKLWEKLKEWFLNIDWGAVGTSILEGIAAGLTAGWDIIKDAAKGAAQAALDAAKGFLGIRSPSEKFKKEVGYPSAEGEAKGYLERMKRLSSTFGSQLIGRVSGISLPRLSLPQPVTVQLEYKPFISTADRYEAETQLLPILQNALRKI